MNNYIKSSMLICGGMVIGSVLMYMYHKKIMNKILNDNDISSTIRNDKGEKLEHNGYTIMNPEKEKPLDNDIYDNQIKVSSDFEFKKDMDEYLKEDMDEYIKKKEIYSTSINTYVIDEDLLGGEDGEYDICSLIYHSNGYLVDENGIQWDNKKIYNYLGIDIFECIEASTEDIICIRNPDLKIDYEIIYDLTPYSQPDDYENKKFYDELQEFDEI